MEWDNQAYIIFQIFAAFFLGGFIGFERERHGISAGIRTYAAVCMGSAMFTIVGMNLMDEEGASRLIANVITGIGFLGAGLIFRDTNQMRAVGMTSAATIWATAAVGVAIGVELYAIAIISAIALYFLLALDEFKWYKRWRKKIRYPKDPNEAEYED
ncbi:MAG: MgtC/SapB family protein [Saprospiraceae bacterium]|nr:MgtC/SapB family protein [Saprospiraceae bacterium]